MPGEDELDLESKLRELLRQYTGRPVTERDRLFIAGMRQRIAEHHSRQLAEAADRVHANLQKAREEGAALEAETRKLVLALELRIRAPTARSTRRIRIVAPRSVRIARPPGFLVTRFGGFLLTRKAYRRYVEPVIADMQFEYLEALAAGHCWHARWIRARVWLVIIPGWVMGFIRGLRQGFTREPAPKD